LKSGSVKLTTEALAIIIAGGRTCPGSVASAALSLAASTDGAQCSPRVEELVEELTPATRPTGSTRVTRRGGQSLGNVAAPSRLSVVRTPRPSSSSC